MSRPAVLLTAPEVAEILRVDLNTIRRHTRAGDYPFARNISSSMKPKWRYDANGLQRWLDNLAAA